MDIQGGLQFVSSPELCRILNISRSTFYRLLEAGLPTIGSGRLRRHSLGAVLHWYDTGNS
jgi:excisionase family DNA binding protein